MALPELALVRIQCDACSDVIERLVELEEMQGMRVIHFYQLVDELEAENWVYTTGGEIVWCKDCKER